MGERFVVRSAAQRTVFFCVALLALRLTHCNHSASEASSVSLDHTDVSAEIGTHPTVSASKVDTDSPADSHDMSLDHTDSATMVDADSPADSRDMSLDHTDSATTVVTDSPADSRDEAVTSSCNDATTGRGVSVVRGKDSDPTTATFRAGSWNAGNSGATPTASPPSGSPILPEFNVELLQCFVSLPDFPVTAAEGKVNMSFGSGSLIPKRLWFCSVLIEAPQDRTLILYDIDLSFVSPDVWVELHDGQGKRVADKFRYIGVMSGLPGKIITSSKTVHIQLTSFRGGGKPTSLTFKFLSIAEGEDEEELADTPALQVTETSDRSSGYITPPALPDGVSYRADLNTSTLLTAAANETVMISFVDFGLSGMQNCEKEYFAVSSAALEGETKTKSKDSQQGGAVVKVCGHGRLPAALYKPPITLTYYSQVYVAGSAKLKVLYTVHEDADKPWKLPNGRFDCSTPAFPSFARHLRCNLESECEGGEDEEGCGYSSARCGGGGGGGGGILSNNRCYSYLTWTRPLSWDEAREACRSRARGGHLVSMNTLEEEEGVARILGLGRQWARVYVGLRTWDQAASAATATSLLYRSIRRFDDGTVAYYVNLPAETRTVQAFPLCAAFAAHKPPVVETCDCADSNITDQFICEFTPDPGGEEEEGERKEEGVAGVDSTAPPNQQSGSSGAVRLADLSSSSSSSSGQATRSGDDVWTGKFDVAPCPADDGGHVVRDFLSCDPTSACRGEVRVPRKRCATRRGGEMELFRCEDGLRTVPFTLLCDFRHDCLDRSDETFCRHAPCAGSRSRRCRSQQQCVTAGEACDGAGQCADLSDEDGCLATRHSAITADTALPSLPVTETSPPSPSLINLDGHGYFTQEGMAGGGTADQPCPDTHFRCVGGRAGNCLPVYVRCNGVHDCPGREDEAGCGDYSCPGFYRCRGSRLCLHPDHVCDGKFQCPLQDDELLCGQSCPEGCRCQGLAFVCHTPLPSGETATTGLRYLDASDTGMAPREFEPYTYLVSLRLSRCGLRRVSNVTLPNLRHLDLSENDVTSLSMDDFLSLPNLRSLRLASNPIDVIVGGTLSERRPLLQAIDLSLTLIETFHAGVLSSFPNVQHLNLSFTKLREIGGDGFRRMYTLKSVSLEGCAALTVFPRDIFRGLASLASVRADNYKLCCRDVLPAKFNAEFCHAPQDEVSSCESLLRSDVYRTFLWLLAGLAVGGNCFTFLFRLRAERGSGRAVTGFSVFVANLSVADFLMGVYLVIVGGADRFYQGSYLWEDETWKSSAVCRTAGFLSLLSSEVSAFIICLITLDRVVVLCFPFTDRRFRKCSAAVACGIAWAVGVALAAVPLLPVTSSWRFYGQSGICIPLPITRRTFPGQGYSFAVVVVFNFALFLLIACGQAAIFWSVKRNSLSAVDTSSRTRSRDLGIARRLFTVVLSDFLCWFPIGLLGLLASRGTPVPGEVNVAMAIFVLPLNSALNPFLYTFNSVMDKRREREKAQLLKILEARLKTEMSELGSRASRKTSTN